MGGKYFIKSNLLEISDINIKNLLLPIPLINLCNFLINTKKITHPVTLGGTVCPSNENYEDAVLTSALQIIGFKTYLVPDITHHETIALINSINVYEHFIGFILNEAGAHWISFRKIGDNQYRRIDSVKNKAQLTAAPINLNDIRKEALAHPRNALIAVVCEGKFIDRYDLSDGLTLR